jgi:DNA gyrase subunit A
MPDGVQETFADANIQPIEIQEEVERSFLDYAMSVIVSRALPDVRDGLKPVQRRILYGMYERGLRPDRPHSKSAQVVGYVMGNYHPHGDSAIYDAMARLAQDFSMRYPLVDGHGNFGSPDPNDRPGAARYTEARLAPISLELLEGIDQNTVDFDDSYDGKNQEPAPLPARFPNLLVNGGGGIAVGMATNIPPHNLGEVIDAVVHLIDNPDSTVDELMKFVHGPDFPTGATILGYEGMASLYRTGRGSIKMRACHEIEEGKRGEQRIIVTEVPYQTSVEAIGTKIAELVMERKIEGIRDVRNESSRGDYRLVIDLRRDANANIVLNQLWKHTPMQGTFGAIMLALVDGRPRVLTLAEVLGHYVDHQIEVVRRRSEFLLDQARSRAHIVEGLLKALDMLDDVIKLIRSSPDVDTARQGLMAKKFGFTEVQANHILDMQLRRLTALERQRLAEEHADLLQKIADLEAILKSKKKLLNVIKIELKKLRDKYADERRTQIYSDPGQLDELDLIADEEVVVVLTNKGYIKTVAADSFRRQGRGGRGVAGTRARDEDHVEHLLTTTKHSYLLFFSNRGKVYRLRVHEIPMKERTARGTAIVNLLSLAQEERIQAVIDTRTYEDGAYLFFATRQGVVKKTRLSEYDSALRNGLIAINLKGKDELVRVIQTRGSDDVIMVSKKGQTIRFSEKGVRPTGRATAGVAGMRLKSTDDAVIACDIARRQAVMLFVTQSGHGKRTKLDLFHRQGRGGQGVRGIKITETRGGVTGAFVVGDDSEILVFTAAGNIIRMPVADISMQGRDATGVRVARLGTGDAVVAVAPVLEGPAVEPAPDQLAAEAATKVAPKAKAASKPRRASANSQARPKRRS